jgi:predicted kinase
MAILVLCCGRVCSGKSTFSRRIEADRGFFHLSADEWMLRLYGETKDRAEFDARLSRCRALIEDLAARLLARGLDVVLDFGFWTRRDRDETRARFSGAGHRVILVYFPIDPDTQLAYARKRAAMDKTDEYAFDRDTIETLNRFFEEPSPEEDLVDPAYCYRFLSGL